MPQNVYTTCPVVNVGCYLYTDSGMTTPAPDGEYSDGIDAFTVSGGAGLITASAPCSGFTTTTTSTTTSTTTLPTCASQVSFDVTVAGDVQITDCCGLSVLNSYSVGSYTETICVPTDGTAITPIDATVTNIVYYLPPCSCPPTTTTTSTTTTTTTIGLTRSFSLDNSSGATCSMTNQFLLFVPVGTPTPTPSGTTLYGDPACTTPLTSTSYTYVVEILPAGNTTGNTIYQFDNTTGIIGISVGTCP